MFTEREERMSQERLLASLCSACQLPAPLYDLEVTGGDKVTVCCIVGRSDLSGLTSVITTPTRDLCSNININIILFLYVDVVVSDPGPESKILLQCCLIG